MPEITSGLDVAHGLAVAGPFYAALAFYVVALVASLARPRAALWLLGIGVVVHFGATLGRGLAIGFFPLTNKMESFSAAALAVAVVTTVSWRDVRLYTVPLLALVCIAMFTALSFPLDLNYPPPLMRTLWYPLHVPLSFFAYGNWAAAAAAALVWFRDRDSAWLTRIDRLALNGFGLWSLSMIFGGFWGVVAWGAYFMWDVKIIWSVILWFHYASFIHLHLTPTLFPRPWVRPVLAIVGFVWVIVAYVGTSFFFGKSSHAF
jgi:ABC-type transport system involved in cytochrome c biogenesis permease subunit